MIPGQDPFASVRSFQTMAKASNGIKFKLMEAKKGSWLDLTALSADGVIDSAIVSGTPELQDAISKSLSHLMIYEALIGGSFDAVLVFEDAAVMAPALQAQVVLIYFPFFSCLLHRNRHRNIFFEFI